MQVCSLWQRSAGPSRGGCCSIHEAGDDGLFHVQGVLLSPQGVGGGGEARLLTCAGGAVPHRGLILLVKSASLSPIPVESSVCVLPPGFYIATRVLYSHQVSMRQFVSQCRAVTRMVRQRQQLLQTISFHVVPSTTNISLYKHEYM